MTTRTYQRLNEVAATVLDAGYPVIVDAAMLKRAERDALRQLAARLKVRCECIWCEAPSATLRSRIARRQAKGADASDATLAVLERQRTFTEEPTAGERVLRFDTRMTRTRLEAEVERLAAWLKQQR
jgi:predicted kinase